MIIILEFVQYNDKYTLYTAYLTVYAPFYTYNSLSFCTNSVILHKADNFTISRYRDIIISR